jgi:histidinol-phosphate aminotransferase
MSIQFGPDYIRAIAPYQGGKPISEVAREFGLDEAKIVKLASNENPLGMPESARKAMADVADAGRYPDGNGFELKAALTAKYGVSADCITLGNGSNDILELVCACFCAAGAIGGVRAIFVCGVSAGDAGRWRPFAGGCCQGLRPRSRCDDGCD